MSRISFITLIYIEDRMRNICTTLIVTAAAAVMLSAVSCAEKDDGLAQGATVGTASIGWHAGDSDTVKCVFSSEWQVVEGSSCYSVSPSSGYPGECEIVVTANMDNQYISEKESSIIVLDGKEEHALNVIQYGRPGIMPVDNNMIVSERGDTVELFVDGNIPFEAVADEDWLSVEAVRSSDPVLLSDGKTYSDSLRYTVVVAIDANDGESERVSDIVLNTEVGEYVITIVQDAPLVVEWERDFYRRTVFTKFTATWCYNCPVMSHALNEAQKQMPERIIQMNMYGASSKGGLSYYRCQQFQDLYGVSGFPTGIANNYIKIQNSRDEDFADVFTAVANEAKDTFKAKAGIKAQVSVCDGKISVDADVAVKQADEYSICVILVESGIECAQEGDATDYIHNFVVRDVLTDNIFGDPLPADKDRSVIYYSLEKSLPRSVLVPENTSVIIAIGRPGTGNSVGDISYVQYMDIGMLYDNAVIVNANDSVTIDYES